MAKKTARTQKQNDLMEKYQHSISRCLDMRPISAYLDMHTSEGSRQLKRYLNFV